MPSLSYLRANPPGGVRVIGLTSQGAHPLPTRAQVEAPVIGAIRPAIQNSYASAGIPDVAVRAPGYARPVPSATPSGGEDASPDDAATTAAQVLQLASAGGTAMAGVGSDIATIPAYNTTTTTGGSSPSPVLAILVLGAAAGAFFFFRKHGASPHGHGGANEPLAGLHL